VGRLLENIKKSFIWLIEFIRIDIIIAGIFLALNFLRYNNLTTSFVFNMCYFPSVVGSIFILLAIPVFLKTFKRSIVVVLTLTLVSVILFADIMFYRYFTSIISIATLTQAGIVGSVTNSVFSLIHIADVLLFKGPIALFVIYVIYFRIKKHNIKVIKDRSAENIIIKSGSKKIELIRRLTASILVLVIGFALSYLGVILMLKGQPGILRSFYDRVYIAQNVGFINYHVLDAWKFATTIKKSTVSAEKIDKIAKFLIEKQTDQVDGKYLEGVAKGKNLMVIQTEALQGFVIGAKINGELIAPNLTKFIGETQYFDNYYCETAGGGTSDAEFLANVSMFPVTGGAVYIRYSGNSFVSMPSILKKNGYDTAVMHAYKAGFWNRSIMYKTLNFNNYYNKNTMTQDEMVGMGLSDKSFFRQMLPIVKKSKQPSYNFLITLTSHYPYNIKKESLDPDFSVADLDGTPLGKYILAIHYADKALGEFIENLRKEGILDNTLLAIYGDHYAIPIDQQNELMDFLKIKDKNSSNWILHQKIPLYIRIPGVPAKTWHIAGGGVDLMPTLMNLLGIDTSSATMFGRDLMNAKDGYSIMRFGTFRKNDVLFNISAKKAYQVPTGETLDFSKYSSDVDYVKKSLAYSDLIIENNLVKKVVERITELKSKK